MRALVLSDVRLGLQDLLDKRGAALSKTQAGKLYRPRLEKLRESIEALPKVVNEGRPLAEALAQTDGIHDAYGAAIWNYLEAIARAPGVDAQTRKAGERIRAAIIPELAQLRLSYASEAAAATERREKLGELKADLKLFPLPGSKRTLAHWVEGFISHGEQLLVLLTQRAGAASEETGSRTQAGALRSEAVAVLMRMRVALADEFADQPTEGAARDRDIFSFFDQLEADREAALRRRTSGGDDGAERDEPGAVPPNAVAPVSTTSVAAANSGSTT